MAVKTVRNDIIPTKSGIVRVTPLDVNGNPDRTKAYTTKRDFLTSTQITTTRASETLPNGNGSDKDYPTDEKHNLALVTQTYDPKFHNVISGSRIVETPLPVLRDISFTVLENESNYEIDLTENPPVANEDKKFYLEIRDTYGNLLEQTDSEVSDGKFKYDAGTKKITFDASAANKFFTCVYYVAGTSGEAYEANPILRNNQFMIEVMAETQSAETGEIIKYYAKMPRAVVSGDIPCVTSQKSINAPITYNFSSAPVPVGVSAFYKSFTPETV